MFVESQDLLMGLGALKRAVLDISAALLPGLDTGRQHKVHVQTSKRRNSNGFRGKFDYTCFSLDSDMTQISICFVFV